jgi:hypothetical protein
MAIFQKWNKDVKTAMVCVCKFGTIINDAGTQHFKGRYAVIEPVTI